jgi:hypothetical protein
MRSKILFNERPLCLAPSLAVRVGLNEAIVLQQLHYWLQNDRVGRQHEGRKWIRNSLEEWRDNFPFWSESTIRRALQSLRDKGLVLASDGPNKKGYDRTLWYCIDHEALAELYNKEPEGPDYSGEPEVDPREMFATLAWLCKIDLEMMTGKQRGLLNQTEKRLREAGVEPDDLEEFYEWWYAEDWRGKKGQAPEPHQVREEWGRFDSWREDHGDGSVVAEIN